MSDSLSNRAGFSDEGRVIRSGVHLPLLDGLRGLAILMVLVCHFVHYDERAAGVVGNAFNKLAGYGWLGVDLFFVLSGFLITGILYDTKGAESFFKYFYVRRALRIFPLYYTYLLVFVAGLALTLWWRGYNPLVVRAMTDGGWAAVYLTNVEITLKGSGVTFGFNHFWSLAIEEQFYLVWPLIVFYASRRQLQVLCVVVIVAAAVLRGVLALHGPGEAAAVLMPCRADSLAIGAFVALAARRASELNTLGTAAKFVFVGGLVALVVCDQTPGLFVHVYLLFSAAAFVFAALLVMVVTSQPQTFLAAVFGSRVLRTFGKYSYGLYVLNQLIAFFPGAPRVRELLAARLHSEAVATVVHAVLGIGLSFAAAWLSWQLLEKRFLKLKKYFELPHKSPINTASTLPTVA